MVIFFVKYNKKIEVTIVTKFYVFFSVLISLLLYLILINQKN